jgi:nitroreductase
MSDSLAEYEEQLQTHFPAGAPAAEQLRFLLNYAVLAPSIYNTQPWWFHIANDTVEIHADRSRMIPRIDPDGRQMLLSCGTALFYLRLALRHFGYAEDVRLLPDPTAPDLLACVRLGAPAPPETGDAYLLRAIPARRTNRQAFEDWRPGASLLGALQAAALSEGARLYLLDDVLIRDGVVDLIMEGDRLLWGDPVFRQELAPWVHPNRSFDREGISADGLGMGDMVSSLAPMLVRSLDLGPGQADKDRRLAEAAPVLLVLGTRVDTPAAWLAAGQALAHVLLRASADGVAASFLNQPIEVAELRPKLVDVLGQPTCPQVLLRLGYGPPAPPSRRRLVDEVLR